MSDLCTAYATVFKSDPYGFEFKGLVPFSHDVSIRAFEAIYGSTCYLFKKKKKKKEDLTLMSIFIYHSLYVSYSFFLNTGLWCYKLLPLNSRDVLVPYDLTLLITLIPFVTTQ
jgi:hypothetical protein